MKTRTSLSHPLLIAEVRSAPGHGPIGITFCPGKKQNAAWTGSWDRDVGLDCDAVRDWGAVAVVTLIEEHEIDALEVRQLGEAVRARHMTWLHLPIPDVSVPTAAFEERWGEVGPRLRTVIRNGFAVLVHCKGGLGRAGMIAARLLVELGVPAETAIGQVRQVRPGAIETRAQQDYVHALGSAVAQSPDTSPAAIRDRAVGALLGLAVGDAVGTTLEFNARDSYPRLTDMVGGGPFRLKAGEWTDDTAMALALADTLGAGSDLDERALMRAFTAWMEEGQFSCNGRCFDIGMTVSAALRRWQRSGDPVAGSTDPKTAGNGSLMRLSPVAIRFWDDRPRLRDVAARQSRTTHGAPEAVDACIAYAELIADAIAGMPAHEVLAPRKLELCASIAKVMGGSWRGKPREAIRGSGYVLHSFEAALWSVGRHLDFADTVLGAANLGEDADTTAAIAGQLAGALYGASGIPASWRGKLAWHDRIVGYAEALLPEGIRDAR